MKLNFEDSREGKEVKRRKKKKGEEI